MPPRTRRTAGAGSPDGSSALQIDHRDVIKAKGTPGGVAVSATSSPTHADVVRYVFGRERVLGRRVVIPLGDPATAAETLCEALGGRAIAGRYVAQMLAQLDPWKRTS